MIDVLFQVDDAGDDEFGNLRKEHHGDGVVAVGGGAVPGGGDQHALGHEHHHVGEEDQETGPGGEELGPSLPSYHSNCLGDLRAESMS